MVFYRAEVYQVNAGINTHTSKSILLGLVADNAAIPTQDYKQICGPVLVSLFHLVLFV